MSLSVRFRILNTFIEQVYSSVPDLDIDAFNESVKTLTMEMEHQGDNIDNIKVSLLFEELIMLSKSPRLGLKLGGELPIIIFGPLLSLCQHCNNIRGVFEKTEEYAHIINPLAKYFSSEDDEYFYHEMKLPDEYVQYFPLISQLLCEKQYNLSMQLIRTLTGVDIKPAFAYSPFARDGEPDILEEYLECPVHFEHTHFAIAFHKEVMDIPVTTANALLLTLIEKSIINLPSYNRNSHSLSLLLKDNILNDIYSNDTNSSSIALSNISKNMNMSSRTLQRKLKEEGTSFQEILDNVRIEITKNCLLENETFTEIAYKLGFHTQSAFYTFFKKNFGCTPRAFLSHENAM